MAGARGMRSQRATIPGLAALRRVAGGELGLALFVIGILAMMILPLPTGLLDVLVTCSIALGVILLLVAIHVQDALRISSFPSLILLSTLFRLAIEVSATRLILGQADAGAVIRAFGNFVVRGNFVVGAVVFLILTLVQFLVIARGAERVAEVGARFTLDAMPGKQMAIDADLRAGHVDAVEARRRRAALQRESQLYGAMDGAMKFVKGDAIAGIAIVSINIAAGLLVGVLQRGMPLDRALRLYTVLTIGDGLVAQIPALLVSTAAGLIVTRVASEEEGAGLGKDVAAQILRQPRALVLGGGVLVLLAIVPGLPHVPFLLVGLLVGGTGLRLLGGTEDAPSSSTESAAFAPAGRAATKGGLIAPSAERFAPGVVPILLELADALPAQDGTGEEDDEVLALLTRTRIPDVRRQLFAELGVQVPPVRVRGAVPGLPAGGFLVRVSELPAVDGIAPAGRVLAVESADRLRPLGLEGPPGRLPSGAPCTWIPAAELSRAKEAGIRVLPRDQLLALQLAVALRRHAASFIGIQETQALLDGLERTHPALVREVVPRLATPQLVSEVLRRLVEEDVSVRNLRDILEAIAAWAPQEKDPVLLTEYVRAALARQISLQHANAGGALSVHLLEREIEEAIRGGVQRSATGTFLALDPATSRDVLAAVRRALAGRLPGAPPPILLTSMDIRRFVRKLVAIEHPGVTVLSYQELAPELRVQPVGHVALASG